jgi:hypothetical protein
MRATQARGIETANDLLELGGREHADGLGREGGVLFMTCRTRSRRMDA